MRNLCFPLTLPEYSNFVLYPDYIILRTPLLPKPAYTNMTMMDNCAGKMCRTQAGVTQAMYAL